MKVELVACWWRRVDDLLAGLLAVAMCLVYGLLAVVCLLWLSSWLVGVVLGGAQ